MPEISLKDQVKKLVELQKIDTEIYDLRKDLKEKPALVEELKNQFESSKSHLNELEEKATTIQVQRKEIELELQQKEEGITKANAQLSEIKTNKEYTAKISEIESIKADKSMLEEKVLVSFDDSDAVNQEIEKEKGVVAEEEKKFLEKKKEVEDEVKQIEDRIKVLESQKKQSSADVDDKCLSQYEKILSHKSGIAICSVQGNACSGCYMNVTPQMINAIKMNDELVHCESCTRILYLEDDL